MTDRELVEQAWAHVIQSTISGQEWEKRRTQGYKGKPYNTAATELGKAKALLDQVEAPVVVPPVTPPAPAPTLAVTTPAGLRTALSNVSGADQLVKVTGTYPGQYDFSRDYQGATFDFAGATFTGGAWNSGVYACVHIARCQNASFLNLDCSSGDTGGQGILVNGLVDSVRITGRTHRCGGQGFSAQGAAGANTRLVVDVESYDNGYNLAIDPHAVKGDGNHGAYIGGGDNPTSGAFVFHVHDQPHGSAVQIGAHCYDSTFDIKAERITFTGPASGSAVGLWGQNRNVTIRVVADRCVRNVVQTSGVYLPQQGISVPYARGTNIGGVKYTNDQGDVVYGDVA